MRLLVHRPATDDRHDFVDAVGELIAAVLDVNAGIAMGDVAPVDIS
jgi:hypothetical protein